MKKVVNEDMILDVAQKWFGRYGVNKTSMNEIADDLGISKASLYYYFPDKESLYRAVVLKEQGEFIEKISEKLLSISKPEDLLIEYVTARFTYFRSLLNLGRLKFEEYANMKPVFREVTVTFREKEQEIIEKILENGVKAGVFKIKDPSKTASLFLDLLKGLRMSILNEKNTLFIEDEEFDSLLESTLAFTSIFINGLRSSQQ